MAEERFSLLLAMPASREAFFDAAGCRPLSDYLRHTLGGYDAEAVWARRYERIADAAQALVRAAGEMGIPVALQASLASLRAATAQGRTVVLFAHWRGASLQAHDLLVAVDAVARRLREGFACGATAALAAECQRIGESLPREAGPAATVAALNRFIEGDGLPEGADSAPATRPAQRATLRRDLLDTALAGCIAPGNRLELADGLHDVAALEAAIAPGYRGTLDLCNCSSEHLAAHLKARRGDDVRVIFNTELLDPLPAYVIVRHLLALATRTEMDYRLLRLQAAHGLLKAG